MRHTYRKYVDNDKNVFPLYRNAFTGRFLDFNFSENINVTEKHQAQEAHFSGKQYALHCTLMDPPGPHKFMYHLSDDTVHDPAMIDEVIKNIFERENINNEKILMKSDNAPQYKNRYFFAKLQKISDFYNCVIVYIYGAAGNGKGLIDAMSAFGCKNLLRMDILGEDAWWADRKVMCEHLQRKGDTRMLYCHIPAWKTNENRKENAEIVMNGCTKHHLFIYTPNEKAPKMKQFLCDCEMCLQFRFEECEKKNEERNEDAVVEIERELCRLDEDNPDADTLDDSPAYNFIEVPAFVSMLSNDKNHKLFCIL